MQKELARLSSGLPLGLSEWGRLSGDPRLAPTVPPLFPVVSNRENQAHLHCRTKSSFDRPTVTAAGLGGPRGGAGESCPVGPPDRAFHWALLPHSMSGSPERPQERQQNPLLQWGLEGAKLGFWPVKPVQNVFPSVGRPSRPLPSDTALINGSL